MSLKGASKEVLQQAIFRYVEKLDDTLETDTMHTLAEFAAILASSDKPAGVVEEELRSLLEPELAKPLTAWIMTKTRSAEPR